MSSKLVKKIRTHIMAYFYRCSLARGVVLPTVQYILNKFTVVSFKATRTHCSNMTAPIKHDHLALALSVLTSLVDNNFECSICLDTFTDPHVIPECLHRFCSACVKESIRKCGACLSNRSYNALRRTRSTIYARPSTYY